MPAMDTSMGAKKLFVVNMGGADMLSMIDRMYDFSYEKQF